MWELKSSLYISVDVHTLRLYNTSLGSPSQINRRIERLPFVKQHVSVAEPELSSRQTPR